jgi:uncharacterized membrane protein
MQDDREREEYVRTFLCSTSVLLAFPLIPVLLPGAGFIQNKSQSLAWALPCNASFVD